MPERETPGRIATAWARPIRSARTNETSRSPLGRKRVTVSITPVAISAPPTNDGDENTSSSLSLKSSPTTPTGMALTRIFATYIHSRRIRMRRITAK